MISHRTTEGPLSSFHGTRTATPIAHTWHSDSVEPATSSTDRVARAQSATRAVRWWHTASAGCVYLALPTGMIPRRPRRRHAVSRRGCVNVCVCRCLRRMAADALAPSAPSRTQIFSALTMSMVTARCIDSRSAVTPMPICASADGRKRNTDCSAGTATRARGGVSRAPMSERTD